MKFNEYLKEENPDRLAKIPIDLDKLKPVDRDKEILRIAIIAELDAVSLYEQLASTASNADIKKVFLDVAKEEKTHAGEFQDMLLRIDPEQKDQLNKGREEVKKTLKESNMTRKEIKAHIGKPCAHCKKTLTDYDPGVKTIKKDNKTYYLHQKCARYWK
jgi:rubrerythrin